MTERLFPLSPVPPAFNVANVITLSGNRGVNRNSAGKYSSPDQHNKESASSAPCCMLLTCLKGRVDTLDSISRAKVKSASHSTQ